MSNLSGSIQRVLIIGLGSIGKRYLRILKQLYPGIDIAVLRHSRCGDDEQTGNDYSCFTSFDDAIAFSPDVAILCNPATMHVEMAKRLAQQQIHLFIEKPISSESNTVKPLLELCSKSGLKLATAYNLRFLPTLQFFRKQILENKVGNLLSVRAEVGQYLPGWRPDTDYRKTVSAQRKLGGGVLLELSHEIDYLIWLFGRVNWVQAQLHKASSLEIDVEDTAFITLGFSRDQQEDLIVSLNMDFVRHDATRKCSIVGEAGTLSWDGINGSVDLYLKDSESREQLIKNQPERDYTYQCEVKSFFEAIQNDLTPQVTGEDGLRVLEVIGAARLSSEKNKTIRLDC